MSGEHSRLAPSSAHKRVFCPGSRAMEEANPETEDSQASREGTAAHWAAAELFAGRTIDVGLIAPNGVMLTEEMVEGADMYYEDVTATDEDYVGFPPVIEERITISSIHSECWGTPDAWRFRPYVLTVWDYKFGHRFVDEFENWQLIEYVAGILDKVGINGISDQRTEVRMRIVQPRCYSGGAPIREWRVMASDLRGYFNKLRMAEELAMKPDAATVVNPHCHDCRGRASCDAAQNAAYDSMHVAGTSVPFNLPPEALGAELRYVDRAISQLEARKTGLEEQALAILKRGAPLPFYRIEHGFGRERWSKPAAEVLAMASMMGVDVAKPGLITPKQAVKAGLDETLVKAFSETPPGEAKLKPDDGTRARKVFS